MTEPQPHPDAPRRSRYLLVLGVIYALHLALLVYALPPGVVLGDTPYAAPDYQTHYHQTTRLTEAVDRLGRFWAYNPDMLAGVPVGLIFDVDNKLHFLFTYGLTRLGVARPAAFNLFAVYAGLVAPLWLWLAARLFRLGRRSELVAAGLAVLLWHFDSSCRFSWTGGMISFGAASLGSVAVLALYYRMVTDGRTRYLYPLLVLLPLHLLTHVWTFSILVVPMVGLYLRHLRTAGLAGHARTWGLAAFSVAVNLYWLWPALEHVGLIAPSGVVGQTNPLYIFTDWLELLVSPINTGFVIPHTLFRFAAIAGAVIVVWRWRRERDGRFFVAALSLGWLFGLSYVAALIPGLRETEPYRFVMPAMLCAAVFGAPWWAGALSWSKLRAMPRALQVGLAVLLVLLVPRVAGQIVYFIPELSPELRLPPLVLNQSKAPPTGTIPVEERPPSYIPRSWRARSVDEGLRSLARYLDHECKEPGRVLVQHWAVGEFLGWAQSRPVIGGFPDRRLIHEDAYLFRRPTDPRFWDAELARYLVRYNIRYVVMTDPVHVVEKRRDLLEPVKIIMPHRVYRVRHRASYFARGSGKVSTRLDEIRVTDARPAPGTQALLLRFHWMETLRCRPRCRLHRTPIPHDEAGFITVVGQPRLPREFVIENVY